MQTNPQVVIFILAHHQQAYLIPLCSHRRLTAEDVGVVLVDEVLHPLLPHLEHLGAFVAQQGQLLQHDVSGRLDLCPQVKLGRLRVRLVLCR